MSESESERGRDFIPMPTESCRICRAPEGVRTVRIYGHEISAETGARIPWSQVVDVCAACVSLVAPREAER